MKEKQTPLSPQELQALQAASVIRVVDDDAAVRDALQCVLEIEGWRVQTFESAEDYLSAPSLRSKGFSLIRQLLPFRRAAMGINPSPSLAFGTIRRQVTKQFS